MTRWLRLLLILVLVATQAIPAVAVERFLEHNGLTSGACLTEGTACRISYALSLAEPGDIFTLLDGNYTGTDNMLDLASFASGVDGADGNPITVRAKNDGAVYIDGEGARTPVKTLGNSYWTFEGFDAGNSDGIVVYVNVSGTSTGMVFKRIVAHDAAILNNHVWSFDNCINCRFEDIAGFGIGRDTLVEGHEHDGTVVRRAWFRWDGIDPPQGAASPMQLCYDCDGSILFENIIAVWGVNVLTPSNGGGAHKETMVLQRNKPLSDGTLRFRGLWGYATGSLTGAGANALSGFYYNEDSDDTSGTTAVDVFLDVRSQMTDFGPFNVDPGGSSDRTTVIKTSDHPASFYGWSETNDNECNAAEGATGPTLGGCPNFYTGGTSPIGSRACFEYEDGTLSETGLWPWRMDDRIKAALARAGAQGLAGSSGTGYDSGTVTSEIVSRYGAIPEECSRAGGEEFVPDFPEVADFPATPVLDDFDRANGAIGSNYTLVNGVTNFNVASNVAVANSNHQRVLWDAASFPGEHEAYTEVPTVPTDGTAATVLLIFGAATLDDVGWHLLLGRPSGGHDTLTVARITGGYAEILGPIDLGGEVTDGDSFGVRVDPPSITVYWKYAGIWYEVGSITDANLPSGGVYIGFGGVTSESRNDFGGGGYALTAPENLRLLGWFDAR